MTIKTRARRPAGKPASAKRSAVSKAETAPNPPAPITAYKAFGPDWTCRDFQYEVGKTYEHQGNISLCNSGFHAVTVPFDAWNNYPGTLNLARVMLDGVDAERSEDSKLVAAKITIEMSLSLPKWIKAQVETIVGLCRAAKGALADSGHAAATGYRGHAAATGDSGHAAATGYRGHAAATGDSGHAAVKGKNSIAASLGLSGTATADDGGAIMLAAYDDDWNLVAVFASKVGENGIEAGKTYRLKLDGTPEEVLT